LSDAPTPPSKPRRHVLMVGGFAHFVHDGFTDSVYVLLPLWMATFALTYAEVGTLKMVMSGTLAAMQIPAGLLAERYGERLILALGTALAGFGFILLGWAGGFAGLAAFLCVTGAGCGTQHPLASSVISRAYASSRRRAALGTYNFTGDLGKVVAPAAVGAGAAVVGWSTSVAGYGIFSILAAVVVFALLPRHRSAGEPVQADPDVSTSGWGIANWRGYTSLVAIGMIDSSVRVGSLTFLPFLLMEKGAPVEMMGIAVGLVFAGGATGKLVCGFVAERVGILRTVILTEVATGGLLFAILFLPLWPAMALLLPFGIALNGTSSVLYGTVGDFVDGDRQARAYGLFYTLGIGTGALSPILYGVVSDLHSVPTALAVVAVSVSAVLPLCQVLRPALATVDVSASKRSALK
jgi:MFS transporter, FSR family, fosmidomycin resistance protein